MKLVFILAAIAIFGLLVTVHELGHFLAAKLCGVRVNEFSMLEDQKYIVDQILSIIDDERPDAVLIAGDIYDRANPNAEAMELLDELLT